MGNGAGEGGTGDARDEPPRAEPPRDPPRNPPPGDTREDKAAEDAARERVARERPTPGIADAFREFGETGRATYQAGREAATAFRILFSADIALARSAFGRM